MKELVTHVPPTYTDVKECYDIISLCTEGLLYQGTRRTSDRVMDTHQSIRRALLRTSDRT